MWFNNNVQHQIFRWKIAVPHHVWVKQLECYFSVQKLVIQNLLAEVSTDYNTDFPHRTSNHKARTRNACWYQQSSYYTIYLNERKYCQYPTMIGMQIMFLGVPGLEWQLQQNIWTYAQSGQIWTSRDLLDSRVTSRGRAKPELHGGLKAWARFHQNQDFYIFLNIWYDSIPCTNSRPGEFLVVKADGLNICQPERNLLQVF